MNQKLRLAVVGLNMGRNHCRVFKDSELYQLVAVCDVDQERLDWIKENVGADAYFTNYEKMLMETKPEVVIVATPTDLHGSMTILASVYGAKGVYCEKPMAVSMVEARSMYQVCKQNGTTLFIGHQRRRTPVYKTMKRLMDEKMIGDITLIRGTCAGDYLSDGSHTVDSMRFFLDDQMPEWVLASMHRFPYGTPLWGTNVFTGRRYGHSVDSGMQAVYQFADGVRGEIFTGSQWLPGRKYQDFEIFGTKGRIWRPGDSAEPALLVQTEDSGSYQPYPVDAMADSTVELDGGGHGANILERMVVAREMYACMLSGEGHPMDVDNALKTHEMLMAAYESARLHERLAFPLVQDRFPLDMMIESGQIR